MTTDDKSPTVSSIVRFQSRKKEAGAIAAEPASSWPGTDPWETILAGVKSRPTLAGSIDWEGGEQRVSTRFLLTGVLRLNARAMRGGGGTRLAKCMRKLGWHGPKAMWIRGGTVAVKGYWRWLREGESNAQSA
jgi:hypothetical protein